MRRVNSRASNPPLRTDLRMTMPRVLRARLDRSEIVLAPGIYDALSAFRAQEAGFEAVFVSGSALAATHLGRPDIGLLSVSETAEIVGRITDRLAIPVLVDADHGFGNAYSVARSVRLLERAGVSAIQIEDQAELKPVAEPLSRPLVTIATMTDKIKAARDALSDQDVMISARTDAMTTQGFDAALERAHAYRAAGADMIFAETVREPDQIAELGKQLGREVPLVHNLLWPDDAITDAETLEQMGYSIALCPSVAFAAVGEALDASLAMLKREGALPAGSDYAPGKDRVGAKGFLTR